MNIASKLLLSDIVAELVRAVIAHTAYRFSQAVERHRYLSMKQRTRAQLRDLSDDQLQDIGITRAQAEDEMNKPYGE